MTSPSRYACFKSDTENSCTVLYRPRPGQGSVMVNGALDDYYLCQYSISSHQWMHADSPDTSFKSTTEVAMIKEPRPAPRRLTAGWQRLSNLRNTRQDASDTLCERCAQKRRAFGIHCLSCSATMRVDACCLVTILPHRQGASSTHSRTFMSGSRKKTLHEHAQLDQSTVESSIAAQGMVS